MILYLAVIAVQVMLVIDVIRNGRNRLWIMAVMFLPVAGMLAYLILEVLPRVRHNRHVRHVEAQIIDKLDPERELRAAREQYDIARTVANRLRLADALTELGRHAEALPLYRDCVGSQPPDLRTGEKLARSQYLNDRPADSLATLDSMRPALNQADRDRITLLRAKVLEELGRNEEALPLYADVSDRMAGDEARCRYAALLLKTGRGAQARRVLEEVEHRLRRIDRLSRQAQAPMYDWAMRELATLRSYAGS